MGASVMHFVIRPTPIAYQGIVRLTKKTNRVLVAWRTPLKQSNYILECRIFFACGRPFLLRAFGAECFFI